MIFSVQFMPAAVVILGIAPVTSIYKYRVGLRGAQLSFWQTIRSNENRSADAIRGLLCPFPRRG
jgi:hypothetical protein